MSETDTQTAVMAVMCLILVVFVFITIALIVLLGFSCLFTVPGQRGNVYYFSWVGAYMYPLSGLSRTAQTTSNSACNSPAPSTYEAEDEDEREDEEQHGVFDPDLEMVAPSFATPR